MDQLFDTLQFRAPCASGSTRSGPVARARRPLVRRSLLTAPTSSSRRVPRARAWLAAVDGAAAVAVSGRWGSGTGEIDSIAVVDSRGTAAVLDLSDSATAEVALDWLADAGVRKDLHDAKGPALALLASGRALGGLRIDTALAAYLDAPGHRGYGLADVAERVLGLTLAGDASAGQMLFDTGEGSALELARQAVAVRDLAIEQLEGRLTAQSVLHLLVDLEVPLVPVLARMEHAGIAVDLPSLAALPTSSAPTCGPPRSRRTPSWGGRSTSAVPKRLQEILFGERNLPRRRRSRRATPPTPRPSSSCSRPRIPSWSSCCSMARPAPRLRQTVDGLNPLADAGHRIHTTFNQMVAATGRLSSTDPNLQNIPVRTDAGRRIRGCFVVGEGFETLLTADYSQIKMRIMAHLSATPGSSTRSAAARTSTPRSPAGCSPSSRARSTPR